MKKVLCLILALSLVMALGIPAFADGGNTETETPATETVIEDGITPATNTITGETVAPTIKVTVPKSGRVIVNPYKMSYTDPDDATITGDEQIISPTQFITNESDVALDIMATVSGTPAGGAVLSAVTTQSAKPPVTNAVFLWFQLMSTTGASAEPTWDTEYTPATKTDPATEGAVVVTAKGVATKVGEFAANVSGAKNYAAFHISGDAVTKPTKPWTSEMKVDVTVAFTFVPVAASDATTD